MVGLDDLGDLLQPERFRDGVMEEMGGWLDLRTLEVFSNPDDPMTEEMGDGWL